VTCDDARRTGNVEHLGSCPECRALLQPRTTFDDLSTKLAAEPATGCDDAALSAAASGDAPAPDAHLAACARCRKRLDDYRAVVGRLEALPRETRADFPAGCAANDEAISLAAVGEAPAPTHCDACRVRFEQRRAAVAALDALPRYTSVTFARVRFVRARRTFIRWAAAAAALAVALLVPRPRPEAPVVASKPNPSTLPGMHALAKVVTGGAEADALAAIETLRDAGGPVAERYLFDAFGRRPALDTHIASALASMGSTAAVPELLRRVRGGATAFLPVLAESGHPDVIRPLLDSIDDPAMAEVAARAFARMTEPDLRSALDLFALRADPAEAAALARMRHPLAREAALVIAIGDLDYDPKRRDAVLDAADADLLVMAAGADRLSHAVLPRLHRAPREALAAAIRRALASDLNAASGARAAAAVGAADLVEDVVIAFRTSPVGQDEIARALVKLGTPRGVRALLVARDRHDALDRVPERLLRDAAWPVLDDPRVVRRLAELKSEAADALVVESLGRAAARAEALRVLARRHVAAVPRLIALLDTRDADAAHEALTRVTGMRLPASRVDWTSWWVNRR
jgi:hypothetical protein